jgi:hypothetical protein
MQRCPTGATPGYVFSDEVPPGSLMCRYRITGAGRLIDSAGNDFEPDGYITFYTLDRESDDVEAAGRTSKLREYRARFLSGQLQNIVRVEEDGADRVRYGLASVRWFEPARFSLAIRMKYPTPAKMTWAQRLPANRIFSRGRTDNR